MRIQDLPIELLQKILDYVSLVSHTSLTQSNASSSSSSSSSSNQNNTDILNCALTCKTWSYYSLQILWHKPIILKPQTWLQIQRVLMKQLQHASSSPYCHYGHFIRRVNLSTVPEFISDDTLQLLAHCCYHLDRLTLTGCYHLTNRGLQSFLSLPDSSSTLLKHLLSMDLSDIPHLSDETILMLARTCRNLQGLNLSVLMNNTNSNNSNASSENSPANNTTRSNSTSSNSSISSGHFQENSITIMRRRKSAEDDEEVALGQEEEDDDYEEDVIGITDRSIVELARQCKDLKRIRLSNWRSITDTSVIALATHCSSLLEIDVVHCSITNQSLQTILTHCKELRELKLNHCSQITDEGFLPLVSQQHQQRFDQLRILELTNLPFITDQAIDFVTQAAPKIRNLVLNKCGHITDTAVMQYITRLGHHLHYLHLGNCKHITDQAIIQLVTQCPRVRYIDLTSCYRLTDTAVVALSSLPKLKRIGLVKCHRITNQAIFALARQNSHQSTAANSHKRQHHHKATATPPPSLERVHLSYCEQLTVPAIAALILQCRRLTHLSLSFIPAMQQEKIGQEIVQKFCRPPPREYNTPELQRTFCVFSGHKVFHELRKYFLTRQQQQHNGSSTSGSGSSQYDLSMRSRLENISTSTTTGTTTRGLPFSETTNDMYRNAYAGGRMLYQYQQASTTAATTITTTTTVSTMERRSYHPTAQQHEERMDELTAGLERTFIL